MPTPFYQDPTLPQGFSISFRERFWKKVNKNGPIPAHKPELGPCWMWTAWICSATGYGGIQAGTRGRLITAHNASWIIAHGEPVKEGHYICHHCDNRACVRPDHLFDGNAKLNNEDMWKKERGYRPQSHEVASAKLNWEQVSTIRRLASDGNLSLAAIGRQFNIDRSVICRIVHNKIWKAGGSMQQPPA